jgi:membrane dipeptidase
MPTIDRRTVLRSVAVAAGALAGAPVVNRGRHRLFGQSRTDYSARAIRLVRENLVIDTLAPLSMSSETQARWNATGFTDQDFRMFRESEIDVFHVANGVVGFENTLAFIGRTNGFIASHSDYFMRIARTRDLDRVHGSGKIGVLIGVQNSSHFRSPSDVDLFHGMGQRISQLTYNSRNLIGNGSTERVDGGISDFGVSIIERMNAVGMAVDVSHCGDQTTLQAFEISKKPVLVTHSNARILSEGHPRAKTDEVIRAVKRSGGVFGVTGVRMFVKSDEPTTVEHMLDHYDHVRKLIGSEHLAVGSDIDLHGYDDMPAEDNRRLRTSLKNYGFRDKMDIDEVAHPKRMYDLTEGLIRRKYSDTEIIGILGANARRALADIWDVPPPPPLTR